MNGNVCETATVPEQHHAEEEIVLDLWRLIKSRTLVEHVAMYPCDVFDRFVGKWIDERIKSMRAKEEVSYNKTRDIQKNRVGPLLEKVEKKLHRRKPKTAQELKDAADKPLDFLETGRDMISHLYHRMGRRIQHYYDNVDRRDEQYRAWILWKVECARDELGASRSAEEAARANKNEHRCLNNINADRKRGTKRAASEMTSVKARNKRPRPQLGLYWFDCS